MFERFTDRARKVLALAKQEAQRFNHPSIGTEHLLLGLLKEGTGVGAAVLKELGVEARHVKLEVETQLRLRPEEAAPEGELTLTPEAKQVIEYARVEAQNLNHNYVGTEHLLLGLLRASQGGAGTILRERGVSIEAARQQVLQVLGHGSEAADVSHSVAAPTTDAPPLLVADCPLCKTIQDLGSNTSFVTELPSTYVMLSDNQGCPGWCVLILKEHHEHLDDLPVLEGLPPLRQLHVFTDVIRVAHAIRETFPTSGKSGLPPRINYECLGNLVPHIHWHIIPRHADDPEPTKAVWGWPEAKLKGTMTPEQRTALIAKLRAAL